MLEKTKPKVVNNIIQYLNNIIVEESEQLKVLIDTYSHNASEGQYNSLLLNFLNKKLNELLIKDKNKLKLISKTKGYKVPHGYDDYFDISKISVVDTRIDFSFIEMEILDEMYYVVQLETTSPIRVKLWSTDKNGVIDSSNNIRLSDLNMLLDNNDNFYQKKEIKENIIILEKEIEERKQKLSSLNFIFSYMEDNKIEKEDKNTIKSKLILKELSQSENEEDKFTSISEIISINI